MGVEKSSGVEWSGYVVCKRNKKGWGNVSITAILNFNE
jgi:hypothetical protein